MSGPDINCCHQLHGLEICFKVWKFSKSIYDFWDFRFPQFYSCKGIRQVESPRNSWLIPIWSVFIMWATVANVPDLRGLNPSGVLCGDYFISFGWISQCVSKLVSHHQILPPPYSETKPQKRKTFANGKWKFCGFLVHLTTSMHLSLLKWHPSDKILWKLIHLCSLNLKEWVFRNKVLYELGDLIWVGLYSSLHLMNNVKFLLPSIT